MDRTSSKASSWDRSHSRYVLLCTSGGCGIQIAAQFFGQNSRRAAEFHGAEAPLANSFVQTRATWPTSPHGFFDCVGELIRHDLLPSVAMRGGSSRDPREG